MRTEKPVTEDEDQPRSVGEDMNVDGDVAEDVKGGMSRNGSSFRLRGMQTVVNMGWWIELLWWGWV